MGNIESFEQFLATSSAQFSIWNYALNLVLTALLAYLLGLLYNRYGNSLSNRRSFSKNFVLLSVATMIVITIVKSSLALSLGLVGALSIVRFRAAIKEPEELGYLFILIVIGLGFGANQKIATIVGFLFIAGFLMAKNLLYRKEQHEHQNLILTVSIRQPNKEDMDRMVTLMGQHLSKATLKRFDESNEALEASFLIEADQFKHISDVKLALQNQFDQVTISLIDNNIIM